MAQELNINNQDSEVIYTVRGTPRTVANGGIQWILFLVITCTVVGIFGIGGISLYEWPGFFVGLIISAIIVTIYRKKAFNKTEQVKIIKDKGFVKSNGELIAFDDVRSCWLNYIEIELGAGIKKLEYIRNTELILQLGNGHQVNVFKYLVEQHSAETIQREFLGYGRERNENQ